MVFGQDPARDVLIPRRTRIFGNKFCAGMAGAVSRAARRRACSSWIFHDSITQDLFVILLRYRQATRNPPAKLVIRPSLQACRIPLWLGRGSSGIARRLRGPDAPTDRPGRAGTQDRGFRRYQTRYPIRRAHTELRFAAARWRWKNRHGSAPKAPEELAGN